MTSLTDVKIKPVTRQVIDVFWGEGWENHARLRYTRDKRMMCQKIFGGTLPSGAWTVVLNYIESEVKNG